MLFDLTHRITYYQTRNKGNAAFKSGNWTDAIKFYSRAIKLDDSDFVCISNRSAAYLKVGEPEEALKDAERVIQLNPKYAKGHIRKACALHVMKKYTGEVNAYQTGLKHCPGDEALTQGLNMARRCRSSNSKASHAARKTEATMRAASSTNRKAKKSANVSQFVLQTKKNLELQMAAIQAQLDLVNELTAMGLEEKLDLLFSLMDKDHRYVYIIANYYF